jgi:transcriptional regulator with XRE-family HTH domain
MLGDRIRELRTKRGMTQKELADILGVTDAAIGMWENARREPDVEHIKKMAAIFGVTTDYLIGQADTRDLPQTVAPYLADGLKELTPEARKEVMDFIEYVKVKYAKKDGDDKR